ncbi:MAG: hypothetical protein V4633_25230 [Pseudomonadota bacterium]
MTTITRILTATALCSLCSLAQAVTLPYYSSTYPSPNAACATYGNVVSCSTKVLDYLAGLNTPGFTGPYGFTASQGNLIDTVVIAANGGNILDNGDLVSPSEDGFSTNNGGQKKYFFTGDSNDPVNNGLLTGDTAHSWDIGTADLIDKLTFDGAFHQLLFAFDFNNPQSGTANLPVWAMVTFRNGNGDQISFETQKLDVSGGAATIFKDPGLHATTKIFDENVLNTPAADDFAITVGAICVVSATISYPSPDGASCPSGGALVSNNRSSSEVEFINYLPTLDLNDMLANGYTTMSMQVWMGCFNTGDRGTGPALADDGMIGPCDTGGYGDIFLLAGAPEPGRVSAPGSLALMGLGLVLLLLGRRQA